MSKKNQIPEMSETRKAQIRKSNCYDCAFRYPLCHNPHSCLYAIRDDYNYSNDHHLSCNPNCDHYISEKMFKKNIDDMFGFSRDLLNDVEAVKMEQSRVTVTVPTSALNSLVGFFSEHGYSTKAIRKMLDSEVNE